MNKKETRHKFREACLKRDQNRCRVCQIIPNLKVQDFGLEIHHITPRKEMPAGGYVKENGICLCSPCHIEAEEYYRVGKCKSGFEPATLYKLINSSYEKALDISKRLDEKHI